MGGSENMFESLGAEESQQFFAGVEDTAIEYASSGVLPPKEQILLGRAVRFCANQFYENASPADLFDVVVSKKEAQEEEIKYREEMIASGNARLVSVDAESGKISIVDSPASDFYALDLLDGDLEHEASVYQLNSVRELLTRPNVFLTVDDIEDILAQLFDPSADELRGWFSAVSYEGLEQEIEASADMLCKILGEDCFVRTQQEITLACVSQEPTDSELKAANDIAVSIDEAVGRVVFSEFSNDLMRLYAGMLCVSGDYERVDDLRKRVSAGNEDEFIDTLEWIAKNEIQLAHKNAQRQFAVKQNKDSLLASMVHLEVVQAIYSPFIRDFEDED